MDINEKELREFYKIARAINSFWKREDTDEILASKMCIYCHKKPMRNNIILCRECDKEFTKYDNFTRLSFIAQGERSFKKFLIKAIEETLKYG